ncbi:hypothetical protein ACFQX6_02150 [Streptosporangium lutulentum]
MRVRIVTASVTALVLGVAGTASAGTTGKASAGAADTSSAGTSAAGAAHTQTRFTVVNLVSDVRGRAVVTDPTLVNPWGLAMGKTLWVSAAHRPGHRLLRWRGHGEAGEDPGPRSRRQAHRAGGQPR